MHTMRPKILAALLLLSSCDDKKAVPSTSASAAAVPATKPVADPLADAKNNAVSKQNGDKADVAAPPPTVSTKPSDAQTVSPASASADPQAPPTPSAPPVAEAFDASTEKFGDLSFGLSGERVQELYPAIKPKGGRRANVVDDGVLVGFDQKWVDKASGITLTMTSETKKAQQVVSGIVIEAPSTLRTSSGVGIGDTLAAVKKAYPETFEGESENELVTLDGWLTLMIENGKFAWIALSEPYMGG